MQYNTNNAGELILVLKVLWIFKNIFKTLHDLNDIIEKTKMQKNPS